LSTVAKFLAAFGPMAEIRCALLYQSVCWWPMRCWRFGP